MYGIVTFLFNCIELFNSGLDLSNRTINSYFYLFIYSIHSQTYSYKAYRLACKAKMSIRQPKKRTQVKINSRSGDMTEILEPRIYT